MVFTGSRVAAEVFQAKIRFQHAVWMHSAEVDASAPELEKEPVAQAASLSKCVIPSIPDLPTKYTMSVKAMLEGAKNAIRNYITEITMASRSGG
jgi:ferritin-like protein